MQEDNYVLYIKDLKAISHQGELEHFEQPHFIEAEFETTRGHSQIAPKQQKTSGDFYLTRQKHQ
jgi:hypothetical protein